MDQIKKIRIKEYFKLVSDERIIKLYWKQQRPLGELNIAVNNLKNILVYKIVAKNNCLRRIFWYFSWWTELTSDLSFLPTGRSGEDNCREDIIKRCIIGRPLVIIEFTNIYVNLNEKLSVLRKPLTFFLQKRKFQGKTY